MKRIILALLAFGLLTTATQNACALGAYATWWNMDETNDDGFGVGIRAPIKIAPTLSIDTRFAAVYFSDELKVFPLEAIGVVSLGRVYAGVGLGYYYLEVECGCLVHKGNFGWNVLAGTTVGLKAVSFFGEVKWTELSADIEHANAPPDIVADSLDAAGVGFNLGVLFGI